MTYKVEAGVTVFAIEENHGRFIWGRKLKPSKTSRVNVFTSDDLVDTGVLGYLFRLPANSAGYGYLMVPKDSVAVA